jgi:dihydroorotate dehydrogenase
MYKWLRNLLFLFPPEAVHHFSMKILNLLAAFPPSRNLLQAIFTPKEQSAVSFAGMHFRNPVGLAAGFDKNAKYLDALESLGFGHVEIGTVTPVAQEGNPRPRLFRLPMDKALINRMGFNNEGAARIAERLRQWREKRDSTLIVGGNIGRNKNTPNEEAAEDYGRSFLALFPYVDYFVVNVSSPNTPGLRALQEKESLRKIVTRLQALNQEQSDHHQKPKRPLLLKIAPDLGRAELDDVLSLALEIRLDGLVVSNTTLSREGLITPGKQVEAIGAGGLSGVPLREKAGAMVRYIGEKTNGQLPVLASGGIFTRADALEKMEAGARLVQVWTGFIYEGPGIVKKLLHDPYNFNADTAATAAVSERSR